MNSKSPRMIVESAGKTDRQVTIKHRKYDLRRVSEASATRLMNFLNSPNIELRVEFLDTYLSPNIYVYDRRNDEMALTPAEQGILAARAEREASDEEVYEYHADCPACLRNLSHTCQEHEASLQRVWDASRGDCNGTFQSS